VLHAINVPSFSDDRWLSSSFVDFFLHLRLNKLDSPPPSGSVVVSILHSSPSKVSCWSPTSGSISTSNVTAVNKTTDCKLRLRTVHEKTDRTQREWKMCRWYLAKVASCAEPDKLCFWRVELQSERGVSFRKVTYKTKSGELQDPECQRWDNDHRSVRHRHTSDIGVNEWRKCQWYLPVSSKFRHLVPWVSWDFGMVKYRGIVSIAQHYYAERNRVYCSIIGTEYIGGAIHSL